MLEVTHVMLHLKLEPGAVAFGVATAYDGKHGTHL